MKTFVFGSLFALLCGPVYTQSTAQTTALLDNIRADNKAVPALNQTLTGTWMLELRGPGQRPPRPNLVTFHAEGTALAAPSSGTESSHHGLWIRVADRKFLQTMYIFNYNEQRTLATITKVRITARLTEDGKTLNGTAEIVVMDNEGREMATIPGVEYTGVRLTVEKAANADGFAEEN